MRPNRRSGFTLVEAVASALLLSVGVFATMRGIGAIARSQTRAREAEQMQRLALAKYDELVATGGLTTGEASGDFTDSGENRFVWSAQRTQSGIGNLDDVKVDVYRPEEGQNKGVEIEGFECRPVQTTGKAGQ